MRENKKGNILKGKVFRFKMVLTLLIALTAGFCFTLGSMPKNEQRIYAASTKVSLNKEEYSALFGGDVIFSVEKVLVGESLTDNENDNIHTFIGSNENYIFQDLENGTSNKTVVDNGEFVKLENIQTDDNYHIQGNSYLQEVVMVSFGAYIYIPKTDTSSENVEIASGENCAGITYLDITLQKNDKQVTLPDIRNINLTDGGLFFDFVYLIEQKDDNSNAGYYKFTINYYVNSQSYVQTFEFYLVNNTSYTQTYTDNGNTYTSRPTLGWTEGQEFAKYNAVDGYVRYYIGKSGIYSGGISYPTITYDYTKYKLSYTHTANQKNTTYDFSCVYTKTLNNQDATLVYTATDSTVTTTNSIDLEAYKKDSSINLVSIMLTEPGTYTISYKFLYDGYNADIAPDMGIETTDIKLSIHGMSTYYSKANYEGAKMQYFEIANSTTNQVDLVIPNGYELNTGISSKENEKLGFAYALAESKKREGEVLCSNSQDALINSSLTSENLSNLSNPTYVQSSDNLSNLTTILENITYVQTNQGSLWIEGNDAYGENSFYFYSATKLTGDSLFEDEVDDKGAKTDNIISSKDLFANTTSFNKKGYYLVFLHIEPNGVGDENAKYWQIFAFQYTSSSVNINVEAINYDDDGNVTYSAVAGGKYTNKDVRISWKKPGVFDRDVKGYFYSVLNVNTSKESMLETTKNELTVSEEEINDVAYLTANLGSEVENNTFVKYLIRLESEGESATHKIFTIDRQDISGVQPFLIQEMNSGNSVYYSYAVDKNGQIMAIYSSITDGYATLDWNNKSSGAEIVATYSYTPFSINGNDAQSITGNNSTTWMTTNYQLGTTISGCDLSKAQSIYNVTSDCILFNQGIYIINLKDAAGNECYYTLVIDRTENYFKINDGFYSNTAVIYGDDVEFLVGDYKAFELDLTEGSNLSNFVKNAAANSLSNFKNYYTGDNNNTYQMSKLFQKLGDKYYLIVQNTKVVGYNSNTIDSSISISKGKGTLTFNDDSGDSYYKRTIYVVGANHEYTTKSTKECSYLTVEINKDNARGMVYYSSSSEMSIPSDGEEDSSVKRLDTGSDKFDAEGNETYNGISGARATSAKHVAFVWTIGTGNFEVSSVTYSFYTLKPNTYNTDDGKYYFYGSPENDIELFKDGSVYNGAKSLNDGRAMVKFNGSSETKAGLYVVSRTYKTSEGLGDDIQTKNYYFIVDRNGIISTDVGGSIRIELMEGETAVEKEDFMVPNPNSETFSYSADGIFNERYNIYLTTTKLPATINVPTGKYYYYDEENKFYRISDYLAGQLNISLYFRDLENQLTGSDKGATIKIFDSSAEFNNQAFIYDVENGCFVIDVYKYLSNVKISLRDRLTISENNGDWLFLSGDYILKITDNVVDELGNVHEKYIAFRITTTDDNGPQIDAKTGYSQEGSSMSSVSLNVLGYDTTSNTFQYSATVSQEYLKVVLPDYSNDVDSKAQVDPNYMVVTQTYGNGAETYYINHPYTQNDGIIWSEDGKYITHNEDGSINVWLDTKLRNAGGEIDYENLNISLTYTITFRYKLTNDTDHTKYQECYVRYNSQGVKEYFYETIYKISIDREAPGKNIQTLNDNDSMVSEYNSEFGTTSMIENGVHGSGVTSNLYFTKQYAKFYQEEKSDNGYIYAYNVSPTLPFDTAGISKVLVRPISDLKTDNLTLPLINESLYTGITKTFSGVTSYQNLSGISVSGYYEIVEIDAAGNITQYVIRYNPSSAVIQIPVTFAMTSTGNATSGNITFSGFEYEDKADKEIYAYGVDVSNGETIVENDYFFKIILSRIGGNDVLTCLTTSTTNFDEITQSIVEALKTEKSGSFNLTIKTRTSNSVLNINLYDAENVEALNIEKLVISGDPYQIYLKGANKPIQENGKTIWYFATKIEINYTSTVDGETVDCKKTYLGKIENQEIVYYEGNVVVNPYITCENNTTYYITMTDVLGTTSSYRFNTSGKEFVVLSFAEPGNYYLGSEGTNLVYYGYTSATLLFDPTIYSSKIWKKTAQGSYADAGIVPTNAGSYKQIAINADYTPTTVGSLDQYRIDLYFENALEKSYFIVIDTRLTNVALRDYSSGEKRDIIKPSNNLEYENAETKDETGSGIMNLYWEIVEENNYFDYIYTLHELMSDGSYQDVDLTNKSSYVISTAEDSKGIYKFEIRVYGKDGTYLGNRVYAFEVQEVSTQIYYVRNEDGEAILANSGFKLSELSLTDDEKSKFDVKESLNLPLFVTNQYLDVIVTMANVKKTSLLTRSKQGYYTLNVYKIAKTDNSFAIYLGILKIDPTEQLVDNVQIGSNSVIDTTSFTIFGKETDKVELTATDKKLTDKTNDVLLSKNQLYVRVYYNNDEIGITEFNAGYTVKGNGQYSFVFEDLAGNIHKYENGQTQLDAYVLREVVVTINGNAPVDNGFYNDEVSLTIFASNRYVTGSISIEAFKNGERYYPSGYNPYIFSAYGTYKVIINAQYNNGKTTEPISKTIYFTIINVKEARKTIDLTVLSGCKITQVLNPNGTDVTDAFLTMLNNGLSVSYDQIMENADDLDVTSGKLTFTLTYLVKDEDYPDREITLSFTMNDENPAIQCSLEKGETTTKGFNIFFNPSILYEQIGEAYVYINDRLVAYINETSENQELVISTTYDDYGDGDYYVKLVSSSGVILDSYKVTIKEPLNFWAIVVIVVIVGVVATVTITIVVLRRKMRIR